MTQRLHVYLAHAGIASRRQAEKMILAGEVTVNGQVAVIGQPVNSTVDRIEVNGEVVSSQPTTLRYIIVNKTADVVSTTSDEQGRRTVLSLLPNTLRQERLYPVGRLDADSEGLILLTNDGELAFRMTHPRFAVPKIYWTLLDHAPSPAALQHLKSGIKLSEGWAKPIRTQRVPHIEAPTDGQWWEMVISEGRKHQVKRMWQRTGYEVQRLIRVAFGPLRLGDLGAGKWREVTSDELKALKSVVGL